MINLLLNIAPNGSGRGLFAIHAPQPLAPPQVAQVSGAAFGQLLLDAQVPAALLPDVAADGQRPTLSERSGGEEVGAVAQLETLTLAQPTSVAVPLPVLMTGSDMAERDAASKSLPHAVAPAMNTAPFITFDVAEIVMPSVVANERAAASAQTPAIVLPTIPAASLTTFAPRAELASELAVVLQPGAASSHAMQFVAAADAATALPEQPTPIATRQSLAAALGERLHVQINQRSEHAVVRLDPPSMGTIEIVIHQEAGHLQVQLRANNSEVARQLQAIGETLRQDLVQRQHGDVSVHVADEARDGEGRQRPRQQYFWRDEPGRALNASGEERSAAFAWNLTE